MSDQWTNRMSEYLDRELPAEEQSALEAHLRSCAECSALLIDLKSVATRARRLEDRAPAHDLWPAITSRIGATPVGSGLVDLTSRRRTKTWSFSLPQLAAAGIALMALSGGGVWLLRTPGATGTAATIATSSPTPSAINASVRPDAAQSYAAAVADLERVLASGRGQLDSTTIRVIEQNLAAIDRAIGQAQRALEADPANMYLNSHLAETLRRKLDLLRQAAALVPVS